METKKIDFIPTENGEQVYAEARDWLKEHVGPHLRAGRHPSENVIDDFGDGTLYVYLGGYVADPLHPDRELDVDASIAFRAESRARGAADGVVEDPEGTTWTSRAMAAEVNWPSYGSSPPCHARPRAELIALATRLACEFEERFAGTRVWHMVETKDQREERQALRAAYHQRQAGMVAVSASIKELIHTTCTRMRTGDERYVPVPAGAAPGTYEVTVERKEYRATVGAAGSMWFRRTK